MVNDLHIALVLHKSRDMLDGAPTRDMSISARPKDSVQQSCGAKQANVATVQRCNRPADRGVFVRRQKRRKLLQAAERGSMSSKRS